ncbi:3-oxoacyl-[acyl-carrier-protein] synthase I, chloroplastic, partial [Sarracenia purpurea var. burkii]
TNSNTDPSKQFLFLLAVIITTTMQALQCWPLRASPLDPLRKHSPQLTLNPELTAAAAPKKLAFITASTQRAAAPAPKRERDPKKRVVITGMGLVSVFGNDADAYYDKLLAGESGVTPIDRFDASKFPTRFAGQIRGFSAQGYIDGKIDKRLDDSIRYCIVAGKKALEDADLGGDRMIGKVRTCLFGLPVGLSTLQIHCSIHCLMALFPTWVSLAGTNYRF